MTASKRTTLLRRVRESLVDEALRAGDTHEDAQAYATEEMVVFDKRLPKKLRASNKTLRAVASVC